MMRRITSASRPARRPRPFPRRWLLRGWLLTAIACASPPAADPDIVRPRPGEPLLERLPGPLLVFSSYPSALLGACQKLLSKPGASAGPRARPGFEARWRVGAEYCAWIYSTPDGKYVLSKLTDQTRADLANQTSDVRYLRTSMIVGSRLKASSTSSPSTTTSTTTSCQKTTYPSSLSQGTIHGFEAKTQEGGIRLSVVAFFSNELEAPRCDGFYQYIPLTGQILKWTSASKWVCEQTHKVEWDAAFEKAQLTEVRAPCFKDTTR